jgi:hypothetical protein
MSEREQKWYAILELAEEIGEFSPEPDQDAFEDLDEEDQVDKCNVLVELLKRPRRIGRI